MPIPYVRKAALAAFVLAGLAAPVTQASPGSRDTMALKVYVNSPASWDILLEQRVPEIFAARIRESLTEQGFTQPVTELSAAEDPAKVPYLLKLDVTEWRIGANGAIDYNFTATLHTPQGQRILGNYSDTIPRWSGGSLIGSSMANRRFEPFGNGAVRALCTELARSELLPFGKGAAVGSSG